MLNDVKEFLTKVWVLPLLMIECIKCVIEIQLRV